MSGGQINYYSIDGLSKQRPMKCSVRVSDVSIMCKFLTTLISDMKGCELKACRMANWRKSGSELKLYVVVWCVFLTQQLARSRSIRFKGIQFHTQRVRMVGRFSSSDNHDSDLDHGGRRLLLVQEIESAESRCHRAAAIDKGFHVILKLS